MRDLLETPGFKAAKLQAIRLADRKQCPMGVYVQRNHYRKGKRGRGILKVIPIHTGKGAPWVLLLKVAHRPAPNPLEGLAAARHADSQLRAAPWEGRGKRD